jgi:anti-anti-sigma regulatory factor
VVFVATDSMNHPLPPELTCRHLTTGSAAPGGGAFYARCGLGSAAERMHWLALVTPARLEVMRALQEEFDAALAPRRDALFRARAALLDRPDAGARRAALDAALADFLAAAASFLAEREERFQDVGLPTAPLLALVEEMCRTWVRARDWGAAGRQHLDAFAATSQAFLQPVAQAPWQQPVGQHGAGSVVEQALLDTGTLRVTRLPGGGGVGVHGEVDARNADLLAAILETALAGSGEQHLDASGLLFCAVSGLRALVRAARGLRPGASLVVHGMPEHTRRVMSLVGWAEVPNLVFAAPVGNAA